MSMNHRRVAVIMAGGSGERFWPLSRKNRPKQLLKLASPDATMLEQTIARVRPLVAADDVVIAAAPHLVDPIRASMPDFPAHRIFAEPCKRNTTGCLVWAAAQLLAEDPEAEEQVSMAVLTADHRVSPDDGFQRTVKAALDAAEQTGSLVTIGIRPDRAETGYGYIEVAADGNEIRHDVTVRPVAAFKEKPQREQAEAFLASGNYLWNSGTFFWTLKSFLAELTAAQPEIGAATRLIAERLRAGDQAGAEQAFADLPNLSIDYALMEKASKVQVAEAAFDWDDVGAWDALDRTLPKDDQGNVTVGDTLLLESKDCIVMNDSSRSVTCLFGVKGLTVVVTDDAVLVIPKDQAQDVKKIVEGLKAAGVDRT